MNPFVQVGAQRQRFVTPGASYSDTEIQDCRLAVFGCCGGWGLNDSRRHGEVLLATKSA